MLQSKSAGGIAGLRKGTAASASLSTSAAAARLEQYILPASLEAIMRLTEVTASCLSEFLVCLPLEVQQPDSRAVSCLQE